MPKPDDEPPKPKRGPKQRDIIGDWEAGRLPEDFYERRDGAGEIHHRSEGRKASRIFGRMALDTWTGPDHREQWQTAKRRVDGGPDYIRKGDLERVTKPMRCLQCGTWFPATRSDQKTCSGKCRVALHRAKKAAGGS